MKIRLVIGKKKIPRKGESHCQECDGFIKSDVTECPHCHAPIVRKYCPGCSRLIPEVTVTCPHCGEEADKKPRQSHASQFVVSAFAVVALFALVTLLLQDEEPRSSATNSETSQSPEGRGAAYEESKKSSHVTSFAAAKPSSQEMVQPSEEEGTRLNMTGHELIRQGKYEEAVPVLMRAVKSFPEGSDAVAYKFSLYNLGHSLRRIGRSKEAIPFLQECVRIDNQWEKAVNELNLAQQALQRKQSGQGNPTMTSLL